MLKTVKPVSSIRTTRNRTTKEVAGVNSKPNPKLASQPYTDNNPSTTLHGTGFKDTATAKPLILYITVRSTTPIRLL
jgi:hypothetical protein